MKSFYLIEKPLNEETQLALVAISLTEARRIRQLQRIVVVNSFLVKILESIETSRSRLWWKTVYLRKQLDFVLSAHLNKKS